ncbi:MAG: uroporphyrinogen decarboxylase [Actinomycetales bacterium]|nr:uroporphyrinogen decarboxylase [Actinomycetales bacterium]
MTEQPATDTSARPAADAVESALLPATHPLRDGRTSGSPLVLAARRRPVPHTPVWFMRQAGRSLPEYRKLREGVPMLESCFRTDLIVEITLQPVRRLGVDAAIFFSDIVVPLKAIGIDLDIVPGVGPVVAEPFRTMADVGRLRDLTAADVEPVLAAVAELSRELGGTPLIGFAGAPFTLASYLVEGGPSRDHAHTKALMYGAPDVWHALLERLSRVAGQFLRQQVLAGASAVQLFDSWVGALPSRDYREYVLPHSARALGAVADLGVPRIHFGVGTGELLADMRDAGADVVGVDFRVPLPEAGRRVGPDHALQGNLDPAALFAGPEAVDARVRQVLADAEGLPGHIFNLGHGVLPQTDPDVLRRVVDLVHESTAR